MSEPASGCSLTELYPRIVESRAELFVPPNMADYDAVRRGFTWEAARALLDGLPGGQGLNIAHEAVDRHANGPRGNREALRWLGRTGTRRVLTIAPLTNGVTSVVAEAEFDAPSSIRSTS